MVEPIKPTSDVEIEQALKQFEQENVQTQPPKKSIGQNSEMPKMARMVIRLSGGAIKEQKQAEYVLLGLALIFILISTFLFFSGGENNSAPSQEVMNKVMNDTLEKFR